MGTSAMASMALKPSPFQFFGKSRLQGIQPSTRSSSFRVMSKKAKKVKTTQPFGPGGGLELKDGVDASGRQAKGKGIYQFANKYGANVDGYSPIYNPEEWSPSGDYYAGGKTGLLLWVATLAGILLGGALLVYNTSALAS
ncbi:photosystem II 10 kDa polypeptide, chloroplastic-like [Lolium rigidum]|uniref:photosystem II 10 kDa polypeptide, chloroplastic-like n=1 Tax=Lolium rigidum TaxID=89674 RepID=UPI001F5DF4BE|nr:photosystem II 10 kDa polypeptide, chloroplastic-like [Lolium rigidum]